MRPAKDTERHIKKVYADGLKGTASADLDERVLNNVMETLNELEMKESAASAPNIWRSIMKTRVAKLTAAAVIIMALSLGMLEIVGIPGTSSIVWADVVKPLLNARTVILDIIVGANGNDTVIHDEVMGSRIRRTVSNIVGPDIIIDLDQQKVLTLDHAEKTAVTIELAGLDGLENYLQKLQDMVIRLQESPDFSVENQGLQEIDGIEYMVFAAHGDNQTITIWADPETALPIRIEQKTPNMQITCDNMEFDIELDEADFSMEIPDGYVTRDAGVDFTDSSESGFVETLRIWAEVIEDGHFPDSIELAEVVKMGPKFDRGMKRAGLTEEQQIELGTRWGQGYVFIRFFKGQGEWHYAGQGVELGDSDKPVFWYQPQDSQTWRLIYGDLHVEDVAEEDLPSAAPSGRQIKIMRSSKQWDTREFVGAENDIWHITDSGDVVVHSDLTLTKMPHDATVMYIKFPYTAGTLVSASVDSAEIVSSQVAKGRYELELPSDNMLHGSAEIKCIWTMPLETLTRVKNGYRIRLQGLIPVEGFRLTAVLEPGCGFEYTKHPSQDRMTLFETTKLLAITGSASCGLPIRRSK